MHVSLCLGCRSKCDQAKRDAEWYKKQAARERNTFFRLSDENMKLRQEIAALKKPRKKRT
jgi:hypothetical protein